MGSLPAVHRTSPSRTRTPDLAPRRLRRRQQGHVRVISEYPGPTGCSDMLITMESGNINFHTRKWVRPEDLNANGTLFGGSLLRWIDEEATIYAILQMGNGRVVTKLMSEINFVSSAQQGDLIEMGLRATKFGTTSLTMQAEVRNMITRSSILTIERIVFVNLDEHGRPAPHGYTDVTYDRDRLPKHHLPAGPPQPSPTAVSVSVS